MKEERILRVLGEVDEKYVAEVDLVQRHRKKSVRVKILLIAACMLLALGLVACATHWLGLWNLLLPQKLEVTPSIQNDPEQKPYEVDAISLSGFADSPESKATAQWQEFLADYNYTAPSNEIFAPGTSYSFYQVYDQTMADKLEEIVARYDLKLHTGVAYVNEEFLCQLTSGGFSGENDGSGYVYEDGSFVAEADIEISGYGLLDYQMSRLVRGTFNDVILSVNDISQWQEWLYTTKSGTTVTLALSPIRGLLIAKLPDSFVTINVLAGTETASNDIFSSGPIGKAELEALAESFDFSAMTPALPVNIDAVKPPALPEASEEVTEGPKLPMMHSYQNREEAYAALLEDFLVYRIFPDGTPYDSFDDTPDQFALADVNGDGAEELLLSACNTYIGGMSLYVLAFDEESGKLRVELLEWPAVTFYENGFVKAEASHNQGRAGDALWPYTLYRYDTEAQVYASVAMVDAWDRKCWEESFPAEADTSGSGVVYYVMDVGNYELKNPMDITQYQRWCDSHFALSTPISFSWIQLTKEAILEELRYQ